MVNRFSGSNRFLWSVDGGGANDLAHESEKSTQEFGKEATQTGPNFFHWLSRRHSKNTGEILGTLEKAEQQINLRLMCGPHSNSFLQFYWNCLTMSTFLCDASLVTKLHESGQVMFRMSEIRRFHQNSRC